VLVVGLSGLGEKPRILDSLKTSMTTRLKKNYHLKTGEIQVQVNFVVVDDAIVGDYWLKNC
jgi:hypothetical protein